MKIKENKLRTQMLATIETILYSVKLTLLRLDSIHDLDRLAPTLGEANFTPYDEISLKRLLGFGLGGP